MVSLYIFHAATSVHWHGQDLLNAAWADGVEGVAQRATPPGDTFRYKFKTEPAGTFWYHAHTALQFADGLRGPLIIKVGSALSILLIIIL